MSNENIYSAVRTNAETLRKYDEVCALMFSNLYVRSEESEYIDLANFDPKNHEHLFLLGVARGLAAVTNKQIRVDLPWWKRMALNCGIPKELRVSYFDSKNGISIGTQLILDLVRDDAVALTDDRVVFASIYHEYYMRKGK